MVPLSYYEIRVAGVLPSEVLLDFDRRLGGLVVGADTNAPTCPAPSRAPIPAVTACSEPPWWSAEAANPGQINGSAGRRPWRRDLRLGNHPISGDYPARSRRACWPHKPARCWPPSASGSKEQQGAYQVVAARDELKRTAPMKLDHRICPTGEAVVDLGGDLDILSADVAVNYVTDVIDRHRGPVTVNLTALAFCDARGLAGLVRMAGYAERKGCPFRLASPSP